MDTSQSNYNLRGHTAGVTALCQLFAGQKAILISGDQDGTLIAWDLTVLRRIKTFDKICKSRVQSLRSIRLAISESICDILIAQSRDDGVYLFEFDNLNAANLQLTPITNYPTHASLFSRGDAINETTSKAILAYPSSMSGQIITIRYLGSNAATTISGTAKRNELRSHTCSVFDIRIKQSSTHQNKHLFAGYEDGLVCCFSFRSDSTTTVPELGVTGLKVDLIFKYDTKFHDFVSAYDVLEHQLRYLIICSGPKREALKLSCDINFEGDPSTEEVILKRQGASAIAIRPDCKIFVLAGWDNSLRFFDVDTGQEIKTLSNHAGQVQDIIFVSGPLGRELLNHAVETKPSVDNHSHLCAASLDGTISVHKTT